MRILGLVTLIGLLFFVVPADAARKCPKGCKHRTECADSKKSEQPRGPDGRFIARAASATPGVWDALVQGFELSAGFRWQTEQECPTLELPNPPLEHPDPFYVGAGLSLPLSPQAKLFGAFDRDWTDEARWQVRTGISFNPFARGGQ